MKKPDQMTEHDLEPFLALVWELEQTRLGAGWKANENGEAIPTADETTDHLLNIYWSERLFDLYWRGRNVYDAMAAKIEGAKTYGEIMDGNGRKTPMFCSCGKRLIGNNDVCQCGEEIPF